MGDKTISLSNRQMNQSIRNRKRADETYLQKRKSDLEAEKKQASHTFNLQQRVFQEKLSRLKLRQKLTTTYISKQGTDEPMKVEQPVIVTQSPALLEPLGDIINPYPVTFENSGHKLSPRQKWHTIKDVMKRSQLPSIHKLSFKTTHIPSQNQEPR